MTNLHVKYEDFVIKSLQDNEQKPYGLPTDRPMSAIFDGGGGIIKMQDYVQ